MASSEAAGAPAAEAQTPTPDASASAPPQDAGVTPEQGTAAPAADPDTPDTGAASPEPEAQVGDFTLTAPEGFEQYQDQFSAFATDMDGWLKANPTASAREALAEAAARQARTVTAQQEAFATQVTTWEADARKDPELGGDGFDANVAVAKQAISTFGSPALVELLNASGLGSHPEVIRAFWKAGAAIKDAEVVTSADPTPQRKSLASALYGGKPA